MGQTATVSTAIIDSTAIGRDLITAATVASAHTTLDLEDTAFTYSLTQTFEAGIVTEAITSAANVVTTLPSGGQLQYYYGANPIYLASATEFRPAELLTSVTLGSATREWSNVYAVTGTYSGTVTANAFVGDGSGLTNLPGGNPFDQDLNTTDAFSGTTITATTGFVGDGSLLTNLPAGGNPFDQDLNTTDSPSFVGGSFSGNLDTEVGGSNRLFNLGSDGDTDTEFLEIFAESNAFKIKPEITGTGTRRDLILQTSYGDQYSNIRLDQYGLLRLRYYGTDHLTIGNGYTQVGVNLWPNTDGAVSCGLATNRWANVASVNGSFTGNLDTEVGGSSRVFNLGSDADVAAGDTEYYETSFDTNVLKMFTVASGAGVRRDLEFGNADNQVNVKGAVDQVVIRAAGAAKLIVGATATGSQNFNPLSNLVDKLGSGSTKWSQIYAGQGRFNSLRTTVDVETAATVTMVRATDHTKLCDCTSNAITVNLDAANAGMQYVIKKIDATANAVTIDANGSETIDGGLTAVINTQYESVTIVSDGSNWFIV